MDDVYSETDECQQHYGRFAGDEGVARTRGHLQPRPRAQLDLLAVNGEAETSGQDLNHSSIAGLMLGEPLAGIEAEHGDVHPVAPVYDLGDNGTGLDGDFAGEIGDQRMRHNAIIVRPTLTVNVPDTLLVPPLGIAAACVAPGQRPTVGELTGTAVILIGLARSRRIFSSDGR